MASLDFNVEITYDKMVQACCNKDRESLKKLVDDLCGYLGYECVFKKDVGIKWISAKHKLPEVGKTVFAINPDLGYYSVGQAVSGDSCDGVWSDFDYDVTHWVYINWPCEED